MDMKTTKAGTLTLWHNPRCAKSRAALALLEDAGHAPDVRLYLQSPPTEQEITTLLARLDIAPRALMRRGEKLYKDLGLADADDAALIVAMRNAQRHGVDDRATFVQSDWMAAIKPPFDLIVANPPYIAADEMAGLQPELSHEPRMALTDEADGLSAYRAIAKGTGDHLKPGGRLIVEIGPTQAEAVAGMFSDVGLEKVSVLPDLDGRDRVVVGHFLSSRG